MTPIPSPLEPNGPLVKPWTPDRSGLNPGWVALRLERCPHCGDAIGFDSDLRWWHHAGIEPQDDEDCPPWLECECDCTGMDGRCVAMAETAPLATWPDP